MAHFGSKRVRTFESEDPPETIGRMTSEVSSLRTRKGYYNDKDTRATGTTRLVPDNIAMQRYQNNVRNRENLEHKSAVNRELYIAEYGNCIGIVLHQFNECFKGLSRGGNLYKKIQKLAKKNIIKIGGGDHPFTASNFFMELEENGYSETDINKIKNIFENNKELEELIKNEQCPIDPKSKDDAKEVYTILNSKQLVSKGGKRTRKNRTNKRTNKRTKNIV